MVRRLKRLSPFIEIPWRLTEQALENQRSSIIRSFLSEGSSSNRSSNVIRVYPPTFQGKMLMKLPCAVGETMAQNSLTEDTIKT